MYPSYYGYVKVFGVQFISVLAMTRGKHKRKRENAARKAQQAAQQTSASVYTANKEEEMPKDLKSESTLGKDSRWKWLAGTSLTISTIVGLAAGVFSFFPHITVSDPVQMVPTDLFSYQMTITNEGILPVGWVKWAFAPTFIKVGQSAKAIENHEPPPQRIVNLLPHAGEWTYSGPTITTGAALMVLPGGEIKVDGAADYEFQMHPLHNSIGTLNPGDQFTFTTEGFIGASPDATSDSTDFAIAIKYTPWFPPIPMQTCSHFRIYKDRDGNAHWFRDTNQCERFPWMHHWFDKSFSRVGPAN